MTTLVEPTPATPTASITPADRLAAVIGTSTATSTVKSPATWTIRDTQSPLDTRHVTR